MIQRDVFVSTSIPYVNGAPHVGFAWELVIADALARYHRLRGAAVHFSTGTDDNSLKNVQAAERAGQPVAAFVHEKGDAFARLAALLEISNDDFVRTSTDPRHAPAVDELWRACAAGGDIYPGAYRGLYCVGCEQFYAAGELAGDYCTEHAALLEHVSERNHFFRLSRYQLELERLLSTGALRVTPEVYRTEVLGWLARGLTDFSISRGAARAKGWGIAVPGDTAQTVYVWFDALANYLSTLDYAAGGERFGRVWRGEARRIHVVGKNVTRFHCIYWPAILASAGLAAPTEVVVHGFLTVGGQKIGKSLGNGVEPEALIERFGCDRVRHYLLRHFALGHDADFSLAGLSRASDGELASGLGNLLERVLALLERYTERVIPPLSQEQTALSTAARRAAEQASAELDASAPDRALACVFGLVEACNAEISRTEPWRLGRLAGVDATARRELEQALGDAARALLWIGALLEPFLPETARRISRALSAPLPPVYAAGVSPSWPALPTSAPTVRGDVLFPRLER